MKLEPMSRSPLIRKFGLRGAWAFFCLWFAVMFGLLIALGAAIPYYASQANTFSETGQFWLYSITSCLLVCGSMILTRMAATEPSRLTSPVIKIDEDLLQRRLLSAHRAMSECIWRAGRHAYLGGGTSRHAHGTADIWDRSSLASGCNGSRRIASSRSAMARSLSCLPRYALARPR